MSVVTLLQLFDPLELAASPETVYTSTVKTKITRLTFTNTTIVTRYVTVHYVLSGDSFDDTNIVCNTFPIGPLKSIAPYFLEGHVLEAGSFISMGADATSSVTAVGSGMTIV